MIFVSLGSGSNGNCTLIATERARILIDCGLSAKRINDSLKTLGLGAEQLDAIFLTHEHSDHIRGLKRLMNSFHVPVFASQGTLCSLSAALKDEYFSFAGREMMHAVSADQPVLLPGMRVIPFRISHDAAQPLAYRIETTEAVDAFAEETAQQNGRVQETEEAAGFRTVCAAVATDMGYYDDGIRDHLQGLSAVLLEANHDRAMLANGPYPAYLKRRIMSREGHLSNQNCGKLLSEILCPSLRHVLLGHLSKENNTPELALDTVRGTLISELLIRMGKDPGKTAEEMELLMRGDFRSASVPIPEISVAPPDGLSELIRL